MKTNPAFGVHVSTPAPGRFTQLIHAWCLVLIVQLPVVALGQTVYTPYTFATLAGAPGVTGTNNGIGNTARLNAPHGVAVDGAGYVYVAELTNHVIRKIAPNGLVTTLAGLAGQPGSANGTGSVARFRTPWGVVVDQAGNVYVTDTGNHTIRRITPDGVVSTLAGLAGSPGSANGTGSVARFDHPHAVTVDAATNLYVTDSYNHTIRKITPSGAVTTIAGLAGSPGTANGTGSTARFRYPAGIGMDSEGNLFVADEFNHSIRKITTNAVVTTFAGLGGSPGSTDGTGTGARFYNPHGCALDSAGNLYVSELNNHTVRRITPGAVVTTLAGIPGNSGSSDGTGSDVRFFTPRHTAVDAAGNVYVADLNNHTIRKGWAADAAPIVSLETPTATNGQVWLDFTLITGSASSFELVQASEVAGLWTTNASAALTTNLPGVSYRFATPLDGLARFFRVRVP